MDNLTTPIAAQERPVAKPKKSLSLNFLELPISVFKQADDQSNVEIVYWALDRLKREYIYDARESDDLNSGEFKYAFEMVDRVQGIQDDLVGILFEWLADQV